MLVFFQPVDGVRPACLPSYDDVSNDFAGELTVATGWGKTSDTSGGAESELRMAKDRKVITNAQCSGVFGSTITDGHICIATGSEHTGVCSGDSGGPLNLPTETENVYKQIGVTSFVSGLGCESGFPDGYTRVTEYLDWIAENTGIEIP